MSSNAALDRLIAEYEHLQRTYTADGVNPYTIWPQWSVKPEVERPFWHDDCLPIEAPR